MAVVQWDGERKNICFVKDWLSTRIETDIFIEIPHTRTKFVGASNCLEEIGDDGILRAWAKIPQGDVARLQSLVGVVGKHHVLADDETARP